MKQIVAPSVSPSFSPSTSIARVRPRTPMAVAFSLALASLSVLAGCPGSLEGDFPPPGNSTGSGGSSSGSGGMTGSGSGGSASGGSGSGGSGSGGSVAGCDAPKKVFQVYCVTGCHSPNVFPPDLSGDNPEARLIGKPSTEQCGNYLESGKPASGALLKKITGTSCNNTQMPVGSPLSSENIQCVTDWANSKL